MRDQLVESVSATFLTVVEQLTFMFGESTTKAGVLVADDEYVLASVDFTGDANGRLSLAVPAVCVSEIAANIMGLDPGASELASLAPDALGEMLNVICGHVIVAVAGNSADFRLGAPVVQPATTEFLAACVKDENWLGFFLEENVVLLGLVTE